jgi:LPS sulfotransferase NodH
VSYEIASQTGKWSSFFNESGEARYNFKSILQRLRFIEEQNATIDEYLAECGQSHRTVYYEDLIAEPEATVRGLAGADIEIRPLTFDTVKKQAGVINQEWIERFSRKYSGSRTGRN